MEEDHSLEPLRRSLVMCPDDAPATALTNAQAARIIERLQKLERLGAGIAQLLKSNTPAPRQNAQLRRLCSDMAKLLAQAQRSRHSR